MTTEGFRLDVNKRDYVYAGLINFMDVPYYVVGLLNYLLPIARWAELNEQEEEIIQRAPQPSKKTDEKKNKAESKKEK